MRANYMHGTNRERAANFIALGKSEFANYLNLISG